MSFYYRYAIVKVLVFSSLTILLDLYFFIFGRKILFLLLGIEPMVALKKSFL